jgi:hypothetical protein
MPEIMYGRALEGLSPLVMLALHQYYDLYCVGVTRCTVKPNPPKKKNNVVLIPGLAN